MLIARDHEATIWEPNSSSRGGRRRTAWTNAKTQWYSVVPRHTQQTAGNRFLIRSFGGTKTSRSLPDKARNNESPARERDSGDKTGDILRRYTWNQWTGWTNPKT